MNVATVVKKPLTALVVETIVVQVYSTSSYSLQNINFT